MTINLTEAEEEGVFGIAEQAMGSNAEALRTMALLAWDNRRKPRAMQILSFVWGRNARHLARAVTRWPEFFTGVDGHPAEATEPDELLALFTIAQLPTETAEELKTSWRRYRWRAWQVRLKVDDWREKQKDPKRLRVRIPKASIRQVVEAGTDVHSITVTWVGAAPKLDRKWGRKPVRIILEEVSD